MIAVNIECNVKYVDNNIYTNRIDILLCRI